MWFKKQWKTYDATELALLATKDHITEKICVYEINIS